MSKTDPAPAWPEHQAVEAVKNWLAEPEGQRYLAVFSSAADGEHRVDLEAFQRDAARRLASASPEARTWWDSLSRVVAGPRFLALVEGLAQRGISLDELYDCRPQTALRNPVLVAFRRSRNGGNSSLGPGITNTKGWTDEELQAYIDDLRSRLGWDVAGAIAQEAWTNFENINNHRLGLVVRLLDELKVRRATIREFVEASDASRTDNLQAVLWYLDYLRLRDAEPTTPWEKSAAEAARGAGQSAETLSAGISDTRGWSQDQVRSRLDDVRQRSRVEDLSPKAQKAWRRFEQANRPASVLRLLEELANRKASLAEFYDAQDAGVTKNVRAALYYLDYSRLKREHDRKNEQAIARAAQVEKESQRTSHS